MPFLFWFISLSEIYFRSTWAVDISDNETTTDKKNAIFRHAIFGNFLLETNENKNDSTNDTPSTGMAQLTERQTLLMAMWWLWVFRFSPSFALSHPMASSLFEMMRSAVVKWISRGLVWPHQIWICRYQIHREITIYSYRYMNHLASHSRAHEIDFDIDHGWCDFNVCTALCNNLMNAKCNLIKAKRTESQIGGDDETNDRRLHSNSDWTRNSSA